MAGTRLELSGAQREDAVRRVLLTLSRFGPRITKVRVRVAEQANPLGGLDRRCRMRAWLQSGDGVRAEAVSGLRDDTVGRAAMQLAKRVALALDGEPTPVIPAPRPAAGRPPRP